MRTRALTHASWAASPGDSYERYELLGDAVLDLALGAFLMERLPDAPEGEVSRIKNQLRSARFCAIVARHEGLAERTSGDHRVALHRSIRADLVESALGAIFLVDGWEAARDAAVAAFAPLLDRALDPAIDPKTALQEILQRQGRSVAYEPMEETGPAHARRFTAAAVVDGEVVGTGEGSSRRAAEQRAARRALRVLEERAG